MRYLIIFISLLLLVNCTEESQVETPTKKGPAITKKVLCGDTLLITLGMILKQDVFSGEIVPLSNGLYSGSTCNYRVTNGKVEVE